MHGRGPEAAIRSPRQKGRPSLPASVLITVIGVALFASNIFLGAKGIDKPGVHIHPLEMGVEVWFWDAVRTVGGIVMILTGLCMGAYAIFGSAADEFIHDESHS